MGSRAIAAHPAVLTRLRTGELPATASELPSIASACTDIPEGAAYIRCPKSRPINKDAVRPVRDRNGVVVPGRFTDGRTDMSALSSPSPTVVAGRPLTWIGGHPEYKVVDSLSPDHSRALATFPADFLWPQNTSNARKHDGYGNAVPVLFVRKVFQAAR